MMRDSQIAAAAEVETLYRNLLTAWNEQTAPAMAALFTPEGQVIGFDGSIMNGPDEVATELGRIFADHVTARYVALVRGVQFLRPDVAVLHAAAGMIPPGQIDVNPALNVIQNLVAVQQNGQWRIALYQNTPAAFHGRPELRDQMTAELQAAR